VLFSGGHNGGGKRLRDTWTWDGSDWTQRHPVHSPPARYAAAMAYDAATAELVLFGGYGRCQHCADGFHADTWTWDGSDWTLAAHSRYPEPRAYMQLTYDAADDRVVLFGGRDNVYMYGDTWTWSDAAWTKHHSESISVKPRSGAPETSVRVTGRGFTGFEFVGLTFRDSTLGDIAIRGALTDSSGNFTVRVKIPASATPGRQYVVAKGELGLETAKQGFTVT
jgi:hypothetical protein